MYHPNFVGSGGMVLELFPQHCVEPPHVLQAPQWTASSPQDALKHKWTYMPSEFVLVSACICVCLFAGSYFIMERTKEKVELSECVVLSLPPLIEVTFFSDFIMLVKVM